MDVSDDRRGAVRTAPDAGQETRRELSHDELFGILKNERRRAVITYLRRNGESSTVRELSAEIAAGETGVPVERLTHDQRKTVYTSLYQVHLPRLDEAGVVRYDRRSGEVTLTELAAVCERHIEVASSGRPNDVGASTPPRPTTGLLAATQLNLVFVIGLFARRGLDTGVAGLALLSCVAVLAGVVWLSRSRRPGAGVTGDGGDR